MCEETFNEMDKMLLQHGLSFSDYFKYIADKNTSLLQLPDGQFEEFCTLLDKLSDRGLSTAEKGNILERMVNLLLLEGNGIFNILLNPRTSTNEIDLYVRFSEKAKITNLMNAFDFLENEFMCECKNYNEKVGVTYVGKFYSLLKVSNTRVGILFSIQGLSGKGNWDSSKGLVKKIALKDNIYILDFNKSDFQKIKNKESNFFAILDEKYRALKNDIDFSKYVTNHENEKVFSG